jgi:hypothetical protein
MAVTMLGYAYCVNCQPESEPFNLVEVDPNFGAQDKCDTCGREFSSLPLIEVEAWAIIEHFQCGIF